MVRIKPRVLLDVDDVMVDFETEAEKLISDILGRKWTLEEGPQEWDLFKVLNERQLQLVMAVIHTPGWSLRLKPHPEALDAVWRLQQVADVRTVTSALSWAEERSNYLVRVFNISKNHQVYTKDKSVVDGDFIVDDSPDNVRSWMDAHPDGVGMVWNSRNNQRVIDCDDLRVPSWEHVIKEVQAWTKGRVS